LTASGNLKGTDDSRTAGGAVATVGGAGGGQSTVVANDADWKFRQNAAWFARQGYAIQGELTAAQLSRVSETGGDGEGSETVLRQMYGAVHGLDHKTAGRPGIVVAARGAVGLTCQSCGAAFDLAVDSESTIYVARDAAELDSWEDSEGAAGEAFESIEANDKTSALELVEDELLLSIPYVPRCPKCEADDTPRSHEFG